MWLNMPTSMCIPTHVSMWGTSMSAYTAAQVQIRIWGCRCLILAVCTSVSVPFTAVKFVSLPTLLWVLKPLPDVLGRGWLSLAEEGFPSLPLLTELSKASCGDSGPKLWLSNPISSLCSLGPFLMGS